MGELGMPGDLADLIPQAFPEGGGGPHVRQDALLGHHSTEQRLGRVLVERYRHGALLSLSPLAVWRSVPVSMIEPTSRTTTKVISSKSFSPSMVSTSAVVSPPLNRLSMSFSSFTSIIERMA